MARVLVVSQQTVMAMSLQDEYDVVAVAPGDLGPVIMERGYDVTVLDAADLDATVHLMSELPRERTGPLLLLAHDEKSALALDAVKGLADIRIGPPISGATLRDSLHGIARASAPAPAEAGSVAVFTTAEVAPAEPKVDVPAGLRHDRGELSRRLQGRRAQSPTLERAGTPAELLSLSQGLPTQPAGAPEPAHRGARPQRPAPTRRQLSTAALVAALLDRAPGLLGLHAVAAAVADDACARAAGSGSAVLVADGGHCVVAAGVGLRPLEERLQLDGDHWLVREVVGAGHGLIVEDTDIARRDLVGAPLSASEHLLVVPITSVGGLVIVARDGDGAAFASTDLAAVARLATEAADPLREAMQVRELRRALAELDPQ